MATSKTAVTSDEERRRRLENRRILERLDRVLDEEGAEQREPRQKEPRRARHRQLVKDQW